MAAFRDTTVFYMTNVSCRKYTSYTFPWGKFKLNMIHTGLEKLFFRVFQGHEEVFFQVFPGGNTIPVQRG
jgi:hypothetical protein